MYTKLIDALQNGAHPDDIIALAQEYKAEQEKIKAEKAANAAIAAARHDLIEAVANYAYTLGLVDEETIENIDLKKLEQEFMKLEKSMKMLKDYDIKIVPIEPNHNDFHKILKAFC